MIINESTLEEFFASHPTSEQVIAIRPSRELQERTSELLSRNKAEILTASEEAELDQILALEHKIRMAKADAIQQMKERK